MSKKDTIIIAILLNAGLLIVLFATSLKSDVSGREGEVVQVMPTTQKEEQVVVPPKFIESPQAPVALSTDEVDQMIKQYVTPETASAPVEIKPNFAEDLSAIGTSTSIQPLPTVSENLTYKEVRVKKGDVLEKIARLNKVTVDDIMQANKMTNTRLKIGQVLKIPVKAKKESLTPVVSSTPTGSEKFYTIKNGDNLWAIAVKNQMKMEDLLKLNNLTEEKARHLKAGDQIRIK